MVKVLVVFNNDPCILGASDPPASYATLARSLRRQKSKQRVIFAELARGSQKSSETEFVAVGVN